MDYNYRTIVGKNIKTSGEDITINNTQKGFDVAFEEMCARNFKNFEIVRQYKKRLGKGSIYAGYFYNVYKFLWQYHEYLFE